MGNICCNAEDQKPIELLNQQTIARPPTEDNVKIPEDEPAPAAEPAEPAPEPAAEPSAEPAPAEQEAPKEEEKPVPPQIPDGLWLRKDGDYPIGMMTDKTITYAPIYEQKDQGEVKTSTIEVADDGILSLSIKSRKYTGSIDSNEITWKMDNGTVWEVWVWKCTYCLLEGLWSRKLSAGTMDLYFNIGEIKARAVVWDGKDQARMTGKGIKYSVIKENGGNMEMAIGTDTIWKGKISADRTITWANGEIWVPKA